ncbi:P-loop containing nucleoside triphosphate hydrolase protein, partial [Hyaloraphidium curvatum]
DLLACLRPFQAVGVHRAVELGGRVFLCDEMGLGKTVQTVAVLSYYSPADWPVLVVCPSSLRLNWRNEFRKWLHLTDDQVQIVFSSSDKISPDSRVVVVSYDLASRPATHAQLAARGFPSVVCDEAHYIKNAKALRTKALVPLLKRARRTLLLTGTPALARPIELFTSLSVLKPEVFNEAKAFGMRYCGGKEDGPTAPADFSGHSHLAELNWILRSTVMVRRLKQDVLSELPEKLRRHVYKRILGMEARPDKDPSLQHLKTSQIVLMGQMWSKTGTGKLPAAKEYLREALQNPEFKKAIVFAHHVEVMDGLEAFCKAEGLNPVRIDGSTKPADRQPLCDSFQRDSGVRAAVLSLNAAGVGLTLTEADLVVFAEISWTPALLLQAEDRAHRIGRVDAVTVVYLLAEGTFDTVQWEMNLAKLKIV